MSNPRVRFAPSPTGSPHIGNLRTAIINWLFARHYGGTFIARLEDTDRSIERYKPEAVWELEEALKYLGVFPDESWVSGGDYGPYVQSERLDSYSEAADILLASDKAYYCSCTRAELEDWRNLKVKTTKCARDCRNVVREPAYNNSGDVVRLKVPLDGTTVVHDDLRGAIAYENASLDDQVLMKSDGFPTYFLACAVDDLAMGITHVIRGDDWLSSAAKLVLVYEALGAKWVDCDVPSVPKTAPHFLHLPLIVGADKAKLSKRHGSTSFSDFMEEGYLPEALFNYVILLGLGTGSDNDEIMSINEAIRRFDPKNIQTSPAMFDYVKLRAINGHYMRHTHIGRLTSLVARKLIKLGAIDIEMLDLHLPVIRKAVELEHDRSRTISELAANIRFFFERVGEKNTSVDQRSVNKYLANRRDLIASVADRLMSLPHWNAETLDGFIHGYAVESGVGIKALAMALRVALSGRDATPPLVDLLLVFDRLGTVTRLDIVLESDIWAAV